MRQFSSLLLACLPASLACARDAGNGRIAQTIEITGDDGQLVQLAEPARRIVSLIPGRTDALLALGAADRLIARTRFDEDPRIAGLPSVDDALTPSVEWLLQQRPDLIVAWPDRQTRSVVTRLRELGTPVYASNVETIEDVRRSVTHLGVLTGLEARADSILAALDSTIARTTRTVASVPRVRVLYLIGLDPPMAAGSGTFIDEMIAIAGGINVFGDAALRWPPVSIEEVLTRNPEILVISVERSAEKVLEQLRTMPGARTLEAVRAGRVHVLDASLFNRPGPSLVQTLPLLLAAIHPEMAGS